MTSTSPEAAPLALVMMGVSASGKSALGREVARRVGAKFIDADDLHPPGNVAKMRSGTPLTDEDRAPWLAAVGAAIAAEVAAGRSVVMACSALKRYYRQALVRASGGVRFVYLNAAPELIEERLKRRRGHFFSPALGASQFATLEVPTAAELPGLIEIDASEPFASNVEEIVSRLAAGPGDSNAGASAPDAHDDSGAPD